MTKIRTRNGKIGNLYVGTWDGNNWSCDMSGDYIHIIDTPEWDDESEVWNLNFESMAELKKYLNGFFDEEYEEAIDEAERWDRLMQQRTGGEYSPTTPVKTEYWID